MSAIQKGYDCEFLSNPPLTLQHSCPLCKLVLREPHHTSCCKATFCRVCIERVEANNNPCPSCKKRVFSKLPNIELERVLNSLHISCTHRSRGCKWAGQLGELEGHLNLNSDPARQPEGCHFAFVSCMYCFEPIQRFKVKVHQSEECEKRPARCEFCNYESSFADVTKTHNCGKFPTLCHQCKEVFLREEYQNHIDNHCPMTPIDCEFKSVGCRIALPRKDMPTHLRDKVVAHVSLQMASHKKIEKDNEKLKKKVSKQQQEIANLTKEVEDLRVSLSTFQSMIQPMSLTMSQYSRLKRHDTNWLSTPFYSHPQGYKMCVRVHANGILGRKGTHVSVYVHMMRGEFDDHLVWPFRGEVVVEILGSHTHHSGSIVFGANTPEEYATRVTTGERASQGWGDAVFISHTEVVKYVWNDCLFFRISINLN